MPLRDLGQLVQLLGDHLLGGVVPPRVTWAEGREHRTEEVLLARQELHYRPFSLSRGAFSEHACPSPGQHTACGAAGV